jgi:hypothetical protein
VARLLTISTIAGLVLGSFFKSTILNNDLGWRVVLFAQFAMLLWTVAAIGAAIRARQWTFSLHGPLGRTPALLLAALILGLAGVLYDLTALRAFDPRRVGEHERAKASTAPVDREVRAAYAWLATRMDRFPVVQHNPDVVRAINYGLYSRSRTAISDIHIAVLFGASEAEVMARLRELVPVFTTVMPAQEAWQRLRHNRVTAVLVTSEDVIWQDRNSWVWATSPLFASEHVRVLPVGAEQS